MWNSNKVTASNSNMSSVCCLEQYTVTEDVFSKINNKI